MAGTIQTELHDLVQSNRVLVRQLREAIEKGNQCSCACHSKQQTTDVGNKLQKVEERLDEVEILVKGYLDKQKEHELEIEKLKLLNNELERNLKEFKEIISEADDLNKSHKVQKEALDSLASSAAAISDRNDTERAFQTEKSKTELCEASAVEEGSHQTNTDTKQTGTIGKPNIKLKKNKSKDEDENQSDLKMASTANVEVIRQTVVKHTSESSWRSKADFERYSDPFGRFSLSINKIRCVATVICLDVSASMAENDSWEHARQFVMEYLDGLKHMKLDHGCTDEYVALVTFGWKTEVVQKLTNAHDIIKQAFLGLKIGGPTPMFGGLMMTSAPLQSKIMMRGMGNIQMYDKIVLITDGNPTETCKIAGPDTIDELIQEKAITKILHLCENIKEECIDVCCVPCGNANIEFLSKVVTSSDGKMINHTDGTWLSKRYFVTMETARHQFDLYPGVFMDQRSSKFNKKEQEEMTQILEKFRKKQFSETMKKYRDTDNPNLPPVGSRVTRGPDWYFANLLNLDTNKPGTVVGHSLTDGCILVDWDNEAQIIEHRYGMRGIYEVLIVDEPKILDGSLIMGVGCEVIPGPQWKPFNTKVTEGMKGTAIRLDREKKIVQVKWKNGERGAYTYQHGKQEVLIA